MRDTNLVNSLREHAEWAAKEIDALRNELCLKCGNYTLAHEGACNGCRWRR
uniref:50S ribosomal protein L2 n=1 Tax=Myoviridae sp. ctlnK45 TaxID=2826693 RepID=A0A8S5NPK6_9CAUD|nr:MAG TPA: 50S ribosomal protein L2 [Myoviridae sp. ctlnK45]